jgi:hypothetical protein
MTKTCKLCQQEKQLRRSHILPEFMYQNLYDEKPRRFHTLNVDLDDVSKSSNKIEQKGIREFLLCDQKSFFLKEDGTMKILGRNIFDDPYLLEAMKKASEYYNSLNK